MARSGSRPSCCGLVGLKPTRGRISRGPDLGDDFLVQDGVLTRTVADTAALLDLLARLRGRRRRAGRRRPPSHSPRRPRASPGGCASATPRPRPIEAPLDPLCEQAVQDAAQLLTELGHDVEEVAAPWSQEQDLLEIFTLAFGTPLAMGMLLRRPRHGPRADAGAPGTAVLDVLGGHPRAQRARLPAGAHPARRDLARHHRPLGELRRRAHARPGRAPGSDRRDRRVQRRSLGGLRALRARSRPTPRSST